MKPIRRIPGLLLLRTGPGQYCTVLWLLATVAAVPLGAQQGTPPPTAGCPGAAEWRSAGRADTPTGRDLNPQCEWSGAISVTHAQQVDEQSRRALDETRYEDTQQTRYDRHVKIRLAGGRAQGNVQGTGRGVLRQQALTPCGDNGTSTETTTAEHTTEIRGSGETRVAITFQADGNYRLQFTTPREMHAAHSRVVYTWQSTCDEGEPQRSEISGPGEPQPLDGMSFTVYGKVAPGSDVLAGTKAVPLPEIVPFSDGDGSGT